MRISVVVPTLGRETLGAALRSLSGADEVLVIADAAGDVGAARAAAEAAGATFATAEHGGGFGYEQRNVGIALARGTHVAFLDDDDVWSPGAAETIRSTAHRRRPTIYRMDDPKHGVLWETAEIRLNNVGTPMIVVPRRRGLPRWASAYNGRCGDYGFARDCAAMLGEPRWREEVICWVRPSERLTTLVGMTEKKKAADPVVANIEVHASGKQVEKAEGKKPYVVKKPRSERGKKPTPKPAPPKAPGLLALDEARKHLGVKEHPAGSNLQPFGAWFGENGVPWCNIFLSYCFTVGAHYVICKDFQGPGVVAGKGCAYVPTTEDWLKDTGKWIGKVRPQPGDIAVYNWDGGVPDHIGIVESVNADGSFEAIEGNTGGARAGGGEVLRQRRTLAVVDGFGRIPG